MACGVVVVVFCLVAFVIPAQSASSPVQAPEALIADVLAALAARDSVKFEVAFRHEGSTPTGALTLRVSMSRRGTFSVRAFSGDREVCGIINDGKRLTEWDHNLRQWTRYRVAERSKGPQALRLIVDRAGQMPVTFALSRYIGSWLAAPTPYEWFLQRLQTADEVTASTEDANGSRVHVLEGTQIKTGGPVPLTYKVRCAFDEKTLFPVLEEISASAPAPLQSLGSCYSFRYSDVMMADVEAVDWQPPSGYSFVEPDSLRAPTPALIGKSVADWKVKGVDGAELPLLPQPGTDPTIVIVWATWCVPCKLQINAIEKLQKDGELKDVRVVGVSIDRDIDAVRRFCSNRQCPMILGHDPGFLDKTHSTGVPTTILVDTEGIVQDVWTGWSGTDDEQRKLKDAVRSLRK